MPVDLWTSESFLADVRAWVEDSLGPSGLELTGEWEQPHCRVWSSAIRYETTGGRVWFKVNGPGTRHEAGLVATLSALVPELVPEVIAMDRDRGWSLCRDGGPMLRTLAKPDQLWSQWEGILVRYAEAQIELAAHKEQILATGVGEVSPTSSPRLVRQLRDELAALPESQGGLTALQLSAVDKILPEYDAWCAELRASGVPDSLQHDDLHSSNICWNGSAESAQIIDWGDASFGCPLGTMLCTLNSIAQHAGLFTSDGTFDDPRVLRVRDAYLEPFTLFASHGDLVRCVDLVRRTGCLTRAVSYRAALAGEPVATHEAEDFPVRGWFLAITG